MGLQANLFDEIGSDYSCFEGSYLYVREITEYGAVDEKNIGMEENLMSRVNVWIINDEDMGKMIPKVLKPEDLEYTFAIIVPEIEQPWDLMQNCEKWMQVLKDAIYSISPNLNLKTLDKLRDRIVDLYKMYQEPELDKDGKLLNKKPKKKLNKSEMDDSRAGDMSKLDEFDISIQDDQDMIDDLRKEMELPEGTLETNLFIPTAIVCTKVDLIEHGEKELKAILEKNLDFIQYTLRKWCLSYGTTLLFSSANSNSNIELLYNYILYRLYDEEFAHTSNINDKEALFVPTGFDSTELINQSDLRSF